MMNFQIQITKRQGLLPMTRSDIEREEGRLRREEDDRRSTTRLVGE
jgi:cyclopropane-fatty-acyl-phospholipid synthase